MNHSHAQEAQRSGSNLKFLAAPLFLLLASCASYDTRLADRSTLYLGTGGAIVSQAPMAVHDTVSYWDGDGVSGSPRILISLSQQRAYFYKGDLLVGVSALSTGREGFDTPTGSFKIIQKNQNHRSNLYGDFVDANGNVVVSDVDIKKDKPPPGTQFRGAPMPYFMRIHGGVGLHAGFLPGFPASHGCIRMPEDMARIFFNNVSIGTPVQVVH